MRECGGATRTRETVLRRLAPWVLQQPEFFVLHHVLARFACVDGPHAALDIPSHGPVVAHRGGEECEQIEKAAVPGQGRLVHVDVGVVAEADQLAIDDADLASARLDDEIGAEAEPLAFEAHVPNLVLLLFVETEREHRRDSQRAVILLEVDDILVAGQHGRQRQYGAAGADRVVHLACGDLLDGAGPTDALARRLEQLQHQAAMLGRLPHVAANADHMRLLPVRSKIALGNRAAHVHIGAELPIVSRFEPLQQIEIGGVHVEKRPHIDVTRGGGTDGQSTRSALCGVARVACTGNRHVASFCWLAQTTPNAPSDRAPSASHTEKGGAGQGQTDAIAGSQAFHSSNTGSGRCVLARIIHHGSTW